MTELIENRLDMTRLPLLLVMVGLSCSAALPAFAQSLSNANKIDRQELIRQNAAAIDQLAIPQEICRSPIIDTRASPPKEIATFCEFAAALLNSGLAKSGQMRVLPMVTAKGKYDLLGLPLRIRGQDDLTCLFRELHGDLVLWSAAIGDDRKPSGDDQARKDLETACLQLLDQMTPTAVSQRHRNAPHVATTEQLESRAQQAAEQARAAAARARDAANQAREMQTKALAIAQSAAQLGLDHAERHTYPDGGSYVGQVNNGQRDGLGVAELSTGERQAGQWRQGLL